VGSFRKAGDLGGGKRGFLGGKRSGQLRDSNMGRKMVMMNVNHYTKL